LTLPAGQAETWPSIILQQNAQANAHNVEPNTEFQKALTDAVWQSSSLLPDKSVSSLGKHPAKCPKTSTAFRMEF